MENNKLFEYIKEMKRNLKGKLPDVPSKYRKLLSDQLIILENNVIFRVARDKPIVQNKYTVIHTPNEIYKYARDRNDFINKYIKLKKVSRKSALRMFYKLRTKNKDNLEVNNKNKPSNYKLSLFEDLKNKKINLTEEELLLEGFTQIDINYFKSENML
jgi:hypothetical protein